jgi:hypothetical protein
MWEWDYRHIQQPHKIVRRKSLSGANKLEYYTIKQNSQIKLSSMWLYFEITHTCLVAGDYFVKPEDPRPKNFVCKLLPNIWRVYVCSRRELLYNKKIRAVNFTINVLGILFYFVFFCWKLNSWLRRFAYYFVWNKNVPTELCVLSEFKEWYCVIIQTNYYSLSQSGLDL